MYIGQEIYVQMSSSWRSHGTPRARGSWYLAEMCSNNSKWAEISLHHGFMFGHWFFYVSKKMTHVDPVCDFLRNLHSNFHSDYTNFILSQCAQILFTWYPGQHLFLIILIADILPRMRYGVTFWIRNYSHFF